MAQQEWRDVRRQAAREAILRAAWELVEEQGLAALSLRELAKRAGITTPTVYAYFTSKNAIYDAMFQAAASAFASGMEARFHGADRHTRLVASLCTFLDFCTADVPRYQLLFQRTIPGFEPSAEAYAPAVAAFRELEQGLAAEGISGPEAVDLWTALCTGLADQQISNDPGGDRWLRLADSAVAMYLTHIQGGTR